MHRVLTTGALVLAGCFSYDHDAADGGRAGDLAGAAVDLAGVDLAAADLATVDAGPTSGYVSCSTLDRGPTPVTQVKLPIPAGARIDTNDTLLVLFVADPSSNSPTFTPPPDASKLDTVSVSGALVDWATFAVSPFVLANGIEVDVSGSTAPTAVIVLVRDVTREATVTLLGAKDYEARVDPLYAFTASAGLSFAMVGFGDSGAAPIEDSTVQGYQMRCTTRGAAVYEGTFSTGTNAEFPWSSAVSASEAGVDVLSVAF